MLSNSINWEGLLGEQTLPYYREEFLNNMGRHEGLDEGAVMVPIAEILTWDSMDGGSPLQSWDGNGTEWDDVLDGKRRDSHYPDVVRSLKENGFVAPLTASKGYFGDGHHRLAAAIELGMTHVPVKFWSDSDWVPCARDSGIWHAGKAISDDWRL